MSINYSPMLTGEFLRDQEDNCEKMIRDAAEFLFRSRGATDSEAMHLADIIFSVLGELECA